jgi:putative transposase
VGAPPLRIFKGGDFRMTMPHHPERRYGQNELHFVTFSCYKRLPLLGSVRARNVFVKVLGEARAKFGLAILGYVVMPEHVHLLISEPPNSTPSSFLQVLKQRVSRQLRQQSEMAISQCSQRTDTRLSNLPHFWQDRFHDFNVWSRKKRNEKIHYMHMNPVERSLVRHPREWLWSSYSFYFQSGTVLLPMDGDG